MPVRVTTSIDIRHGNARSRALPPRPYACTPHTTRICQLTDAMTKYYVLFETCSQRVRILPNKSQHYEVAVEKWKRRLEFYRPSRSDETARAKCFSAVDDVCNIESRTPEE